MLKRPMRALYVWGKAFFTKSARAHYAQFGEDVLLDALIDPHCAPGTYVDVGAWHPKKFSNTYFLYRRGWRGVNIDLDAAKIEAFQLARPGDVNVCAAVSDARRRVRVFSFGRYGLGSTIDSEHARMQDRSPSGTREVETRTLDEILAGTRYAGQAIDLLSIDAEGHDYPVLRSIDLATYRPQIIVIESYAHTVDEILRSPAYLYLVARGYSLRGWAHFSLIFCLPEGSVFRRTPRS